MSAAIVTDLKQWGYCPRIVYYRQIMPGVAKPTFKMEEAHNAQEMIERLELRRGLGQYGLENAKRRFGLWLTDETIGLTGKIDLVLESERSAAVVDFKLTSGEPGENHRLQLGGYALLAEICLKKPVEVGFLYRIPDNRLYTIPIDQMIRSRVQKALYSISEIREQQLFPEATSLRARCAECEYANYCSDIW
ncbi:MAG: CRISPR-associated protein Cas4 [Terriglobia bacterium]|nr:MAG: CRISPR-associated protein Cas4 [Terriglobia bacterium]